MGDAAEELDTDLKEGEEQDLDTVFDEMAEKREGEDVAAPADEINLDGGDAADELDTAKTDDVAAADDSGASDEDPFKGWPEEAVTKYREQQATNEKLEHRISSDAGRVSAFQRKADIANQELDRIKAGGDVDAPSTDEITAALSSDEDWKEFQEEHPEIAAAIDNRLNGAIKVHGEQVEKKLAPMVESQHNADMQDANDAIEDTYPTWQQDVGTQEFNDWKSSQSAVIRGLGASDKAEDALSMLELYDNHRVANGLPSLKKGNLSDNESDVDDTDEHEKRRQEQLEDGAGIESKPAGVNDAGADLNSLDAEWNRQAQMRESKKTG